MITSGRCPWSWLNATSIMCSESRGAPEMTFAARPMAWSESMFSHVTPRLGPKYLRFGRA